MEPVSGTYPGHGKLPENSQSIVVYSLEYTDVKNRTVIEWD